MEQKLMLVINPAAGRGGYKYSLGEALSALDQGGMRTTLFFTGGPGDATRFAAEHGGEYDIAACVGGDGTLSELLSGLMRLEKRPRVGYFPMGTANDVATTLNLPKNDMQGAARRLLQGTPHPYDLGAFGDEGYFAYIAAFGAFTEVSYATPQSQKRTWGHLAYVLQGAAALGRIESVHTVVEHDGGVEEGELLYGSMSNSTSVAGIVHLREEMVGLGDGMSELVLVRDPGSVAGFGEIVESVLSQRFDSEYLQILQTRRARFTFDRSVTWTRDGEAGGEHRTLELRNCAAPVEFIF